MQHFYLLNRVCFLCASCNNINHVTSGNAALHQLLLLRAGWLTCGLPFACFLLSLVDFSVLLNCYLERREKKTLPNRRPDRFGRGFSYCDFFGQNRVRCLLSVLCGYYWDLLSCRHEDREGDSPSPA